MRAVALQRHSQFRIRTGKPHRPGVLRETPERVVALGCHSHTLLGWTLTQRSRIRVPVHCTNKAYPKTCPTATRSHGGSRLHANTRLVGLPPVGTACAFPGALRGLKLVPSKWRCLVPPTSG